MFLRFLLIGAVVAIGSDLDPPAGADLARWANQAHTWCNARIESLASQTRESAPTPAVAEPATSPIPTPAPIAVAAADPDAAFQHAMNDTLNTFVADLSPAPAASPDASLLAAVEPAPAAEAEPAPTVSSDTPTQLVAAEEWLTQAPTFDFEAARALAAETQSCDAFPAGQLALVDNPAQTPPVAEPVPAAEPVAVANPAPAAEAVAVAEPVPAVEPVAVAEPAPAVEPAPVAEAVAVVEPAPVAEPAPVSEPVEVATGTSESSFAADETDRAERLNAAVRLTGEAVQAWARLLGPPHVAYHDQAGVLSR
jgi:hypothetical protein